MQQVFPDHAPLAVASLYESLTLPEHPDRAWVALGMVSTLDGAAAIDGGTESLGGDADAVAFRRLRASADVILVGAGTVRDENYGPPLGPAERRADRAGRGLADHPRLAIVSGSLQLHVEHRVFSHPAHRPILFTHEQAPANLRARLSEAAELVNAGDSTVDLASALTHLHGRGLRRVLCEGGPTLNGALLAADLVDEVFLTIAPVAVGGMAPRIVRSSWEEVARDFRLVTVYEHDGELVLRYSRVR